MDSGSTEHAPQVDPATTSEHFHHTLHLVQLFEQLVDFLDALKLTFWLLVAVSIARAACDPLLAAGVQNLGVAAFFESHGTDHGFDLFDAAFGVFLIDLVFDLAETSDHVQQLPDWTHS